MKTEEISHEVDRLDESVLPQDQYRIPNMPEYDKAHCPKCGITLEWVMMYSCPHYNCPTGLGGLTTCIA